VVCLLLHWARTSNPSLTSRTEKADYTNTNTLSYIAEELLKITLNLFLQSLITRVQKEGGWIKRD